MRGVGMQEGNWRTEEQGRGDEGGSTVGMQIEKTIKNKIIKKESIAEKVIQKKKDSN